MTIADELREAVRKPGTRCTVAVFLEQQPDADRAEWDAALRDESIPGSALLTVMRRRGYHSHNPQAILRHRRSALGRSGGCACPSLTS